MRKLLLLGWVLLGLGCAHPSVVAADLDRVHRPAFVSRVEEHAGPHSVVFQEDPAWRARLDRLDPKEADRRLALKLAKAATRFQVSDGLRASLLALLPKELPWTRTIPPGTVASALDSFLVEEVPANPPDYELLARIGADSVLEIVVQDFGMRSQQGRAQAYLKGYARLFPIGGPDVWRRPFQRDNVADGAPSLSPFDVGKQPELFRDAFAGIIESVAGELASGLKPREPHMAPVSPARAEPSSEKDAPPVKAAPAVPPPPHRPEDEL